MNAPYRTIAELKMIFKVSDDRTIAKAFEGNLKVVDDTLCVKSDYLIERFGFDPQEPFYTRAEVMQKLGIDLSEFNRLVNYKHLPVFSLRNRRGSTTLVLKRDLDALQDLVIHYSNDTSLFVRHNSKVVNLLMRMFEQDARNSRVMVEDERDMALLRLYFKENLSITEIAKEISRSNEAVRQRLDRCMLRFDKLMSYIDSVSVEQEKIREDNERLIAENKVLIEALGYNNLCRIPDVYDENPSPLQLCKMMRVLKWDDIDMSVRLYNFLKGVETFWNTHHRRSELGDFSSSVQWLLELDMGELYKCRGFGEKTTTGLINIVESLGCICNEKKFLKITPENVASIVKEPSKLLEYYKMKKR